MVSLQIGKENKRFVTYPKPYWEGVGWGDRGKVVLSHLQVNQNWNTKSENHKQQGEWGCVSRIKSLNWKIQINPKATGSPNFQGFVNRYITIKELKIPNRENIFNLTHNKRNMNTNVSWTGEMAQWFQVLAVLAEDMGEVPSTHTAAHNCL